MVLDWDLLRQALLNLGYDKHYSCLLEHGIDCIENLELFIQNDWCHKLNSIPTAYWLRIQNEVHNLQSAQYNGLLSLLL